MAATTPSYIEPSVLADKIKTKTNDGVLIVDVRDDEEFAEGHIVGASLKPSSNWTEDAFVDEVITTAQSNGTKTVVFHCMKSQVRGPTCARRFLERLEQHPEENRPEVQVLRGGYAAWSNFFADDAELTEK